MLTVSTIEALAQLTQFVEFTITMFKSGTITNAQLDAIMQQVGVNATTATNAVEAQN